MNAYTRARVERIADTALRDAGVLGQLPTPLEEVQRAAGIRTRHPIGELPDGLATPGRALLGALWFDEKKVFVDLGQPEPRRRFTDAHEAMHALCPWHEATLREDTESELFRATRVALEAEANLGAAELIFQRHLLRADLSEMPATVETARALAARYGGSLRATMHQIAAHHPARAALMVVGRFPDAGGRLPVWRSVGAGAEGLPHVIGARHPLHRALEAARRFESAPPGIVRFGGSRWLVDTHFNRRCHLVLVTPLNGVSRPAVRARSCHPTATAASDSRTPSRDPAAASPAARPAVPGRR